MIKAKLFYDKVDDINFGNHGRLNIDDKIYILKDEAEFTNRCLSNKYEFELSTPAVDLEGNEYIVYWIFEEVEGWELDQYDYENIDRIIKI